MTENRPTLQVEQAETDHLVTADELAAIDAGTYLGDGCSETNGTWTWTRVRVVANDRKARIIVVRFPHGEYVVTDYDEAHELYVRWADVRLRPARPLPFSYQTWAA
jgi:hypothetical protein